MNENLSTNQFVAQHAGFDKWAKGQERELRDAHTTGPHTSYPREVGRRVSHLRSARSWLENTYSGVAHEGFEKKRPQHEILKGVGVPLHEALPEQYHPLVDEYLNKSRVG